VATLDSAATDDQNGANTWFVGCTSDAVGARILFDCFWQAL